jgi:two-component system phosphate regulon sensor histidine kinase PhoR
VRHDGTAELSVTDTGEGIPEEALGRVFDRFYRVDSSRSRATGGHGLGLSIALRIATLHDAELTAESRPGEGSRFTVRFRRDGGLR